MKLNFFDGGGLNGYPPPGGTAACRPKAYPRPACGEHHSTSDPPAPDCRHETANPPPGFFPTRQAMRPSRPRRAAGFRLACIAFPAQIAAQFLIRQVKFDFIRRASQPVAPHGAGLKIHQAHPGALEKRQHPRHLPPMRATSSTRPTSLSVTQLASGRYDAHHHNRARKRSGASLRVTISLSPTCRHRRRTLAVAR